MLIPSSSRRASSSGETSATRDASNSSGEPGPAEHKSWLSRSELSTLHIQLHTCRRFRRVASWGETTNLHGLKCVLTASTRLLESAAPPLFERRASEKRVGVVRSSPACPAWGTGSDDIKIEFPATRALLVGTPAGRRQELHTRRKTLFCPKVGATARARCCLHPQHSCSCCCAPPAWTTCA